MTKDYIQHTNLLHKQINNLARTGLAAKFLKLDNHQRNTVINNVLLQLLKAEKDGLLILKEFDDYKGYMFVSIKNEINGIYEVLKRKKVQVTYQKILDHPKLKEPFDIPIVVDEDINLRLNYLSPFNRALFRWVRRGLTLVDLSRGTGVAKTTLGHRIHKIERFLAGDKTLSKLEIRWLAK